MVMEDEIKRWTAKRKSALVLDIIQGKTTVAEASRAYDLPPSERRPPALSSGSI
jgi:transposase-like protein